MTISIKHQVGNTKLTDHSNIKEAVMDSVMDNSISDGLRKNRKHEDSNQNQLWKYGD